MKSLSAFQRDLLYIIAGIESEPYGLMIKDEFESYSGKELSTARLYTNLDELVSAGYLTRSELDGRTNEYELTADGRKMMAARIEWATDNLGVEA